MRCPYCRHDETKVLDSRESDTAVRRRRECEKCLKRFTTYEKAETVDLLVIKKDQNRETFDRMKIIRGLTRACEKRPITLDQLENIADEIEQELRQKDTIEIKSNIIGELIMSKLKNLDKVAYIRFASVYRDFTDVDQFKKELTTLTKQQ